MGKNKPGFRTKGNVQASSSSKAAELLDISHSDFLNPFFGVDESNGKVDQDFAVAVKKLSKKDPSTRIKGLQDIKHFYQEKDRESVIATIGMFTLNYSKTALDNDKRVRELSHECLGGLVGKVGKLIAVHLRGIVVVWLLAQSDTHPSCASAAKQVFEESFNAERQSSLVNMYKKKIISDLADNLFSMSINTITDTKICEKDEVEGRYVRLLTSSLDAFTRLVGLLGPMHQSEVADDLMAVLFDQSKFWKFNKNQYPSVRRAFLDLVSCLLNVYADKTVKQAANDANNTSPTTSTTPTTTTSAITTPTTATPATNLIKDGHKQLLVPSVLQLIDDNNHSVMPSVWNAVNAILSHFPDCWKYVNMKKMFLPKLWNLIDLCGYGSVHHSHPHLIVIIHKLPVEVKQDEAFYSKFFQKLLSSLSNDKVFVNVVQKTIIVHTLIECFKYHTHYLNVTSHHSKDTSAITHSVCELLREAVLDRRFSDVSDVIFKHVWKLFLHFTSTITNEQDAANKASMGLSYQAYAEALLKEMVQMVGACNHKLVEFVMSSMNVHEIVKKKEKSVAFQETMDGGKGDEGSKDGKGDEGGEDGDENGGDKVDSCVFNDAVWTSAHMYARFAALYEEDLVFKSFIQRLLISTFDQLSCKDNNTDVNINKMFALLFNMYADEDIITKCNINLLRKTELDSEDDADVGTFFKLFLFPLIHTSSNANLPFALHTFLVCERIKSIQNNDKQGVTEKHNYLATLFDCLREEVIREEGVDGREEGNCSGELRCEGNEVDVLEEEMLDKRQEVLLCLLQMAHKNLEVKNLLNKWTREDASAKDLFIHSASQFFDSFSSLTKGDEKLWSLLTHSLGQLDDYVFILSSLQEFVKERLLEKGSEDEKSLEFTRKLVAHLNEDNFILDCYESSCVSWFLNVLLESSLKYYRDDNEFVKKPMSVFLSSFERILSKKAENKGFLLKNFQMFHDTLEQIFKKVLSHHDFPEACFIASMAAELFDVVTRHVKEEGVLGWFRKESENPHDEVRLFFLYSNLINTCKHNIVLSADQVKEHIIQYCSISHTLTSLRHDGQVEDYQSIRDGCFSDVYKSASPEVLISVFNTMAKRCLTQQITESEESANKHFMTFFIFLREISFGGDEFDKVIESRVEDLMAKCACDLDDAVLKTLLILISSSCCRHYLLNHDIICNWFSGIETSGTHAIFERLLTLSNFLVMKEKHLSCSPLLARLITLTTTLPSQYFLFATDFNPKLCELNCQIMQLHQSYLESFHAKTLATKYCQEDGNIAGFVTKGDSDYPHRTRTPSYEPLTISSNSAIRFSSFLNPPIISTGSNTPPTTPTESNNSSTTPTEPNNSSTTPTEPNNLPTTPTESNNSSTTPTKSNNSSTTPTEPNNSSTTPTEPNNSSTTPTEPNNLPTTPTESNNIPTTPTESNNPPTTSTISTTDHFGSEIWDCISCACVSWLQTSSNYLYSSHNWKEDESFNAFLHAVLKLIQSFNSHFSSSKDIDGKISDEWLNVFKPSIYQNLCQLFTLLLSNRKHLSPLWTRVMMDLCICMNDCPPTYLPTILPSISSATIDVDDKYSTDTTETALALVDHLIPLLSAHSVLLSQQAPYDNLNQQEYTHSMTTQTSYDLLSQHIQVCIRSLIKKVLKPYVRCINEKYEKLEAENKVVKSLKDNWMLAAASELLEEEDSMVYEEDETTLTPDEFMPTFLTAFQQCMPSAFSIKDSVGSITGGSPIYECLEYFLMVDLLLEMTQLFTSKVKTSVSKWLSSSGLFSKHMDVLFKYTLLSPSIQLQRTAHQDWDAFIFHLTQPQHPSTISLMQSLVIKQFNFLSSGSTIMHKDIIKNCLIHCAPHSSLFPHFFGVVHDNVFDPKKLSFRLYVRTCQHLPLLVRTWFSNLSRSSSSFFDTYTTENVSPNYIARELSSLEASDKKAFGENMHVQVRPASKEMVATYMLDDVNISLVISYPSNAPLGKLEIGGDVDRVVCIKQSMPALKFKLYKLLRFKEGSLREALKLWQRNLDRQLDGRSCMICYSLVLDKNGSKHLPTLQCKTCRKMFHNLCLYTWFKTSSKSLCPLCRTTFA